MEKQLKSETIFEGNIIKVTHDEVELPDGSHAMRECVYHRGGVCILAVEDGCILLIKQYRYPNRTDTLEIPAGKLEEGENPDTACYREFEEETDRRAKNMRFILKLYPTPGFCSEIDYLYEAEDFKYVDDSLPQDDDEFLKLVKMPVDEAYAKVLDGTIFDAKTIIAIQYAYQKYHKN
jgi:ADP-ribose pyrophosphatase